MDAQAETQGIPPTPAPRPRLSKLTLVVIVLAAIVFVSALGAILAVSSEKPLPIIVTDIVIRSPDDACGLGTRGVSFEGFNASTRQSQPFVFPISNYNSTSCTIRGVRTNTTGFTVSDTNVPVTISPGYPGPDLVLTVTSPSSPYSGILTLVLT